ELLLPDALQLRRTATGDLRQSRWVSVTHLRGPGPPGRAGMRRAQDLEESVVLQPRLALIEERGVLRGLDRRHLGRLDQGGVAGEVGAHPIRRAVRPDRARGQDLPDGKARLREPVDEIAPAAAEGSC